MNPVLRISFRVLAVVLLLTTFSLEAPQRAAAAPGMGVNGVILLQANDGRPDIALMDPGHSYAYFAASRYVDTAKLFKVKLDDFTLATTWSFPAGEDDIRAGVIDPTGTYAYFGVGWLPGKIVKVRLSDLTQVGELALGASEAATSAVMDPNGQYAYFGLYTDFGTAEVIKVRLADLARVATITLPSAYNSAVINRPVTGLTYNGYLYFATGDWSKYNMIIRIQTSDFTFDDGFVFYQDIFCGSGIDNFKHQLYFITDGFDLYPLDPDPYQLGYAITIPESRGYGSLRTIGVDGLRGYAYIGTAYGWLVQLPLDNPTSGFALDLGQGGLTQPASSLIDEFAGYLYLGYAASPNRILRVEIGDPISLDNHNYLVVMGR